MILGLGCIHQWETLDQRLADTAKYLSE